MTTKTKTKWRLGALPKPTELTLLTKEGLLTKDEAREILISLETEEDRTKKSLQEEIKFLRELVAKLTTSRSVIVENIRVIEKPYRQYEWYQPYYQYATTAGTSSLTYTTGTAGATTAAYSSSIAAGINGVGAPNSALAQQLQLANNVSFTDIKTF